MRHLAAPKPSMPVRADVLLDIGSVQQACRAELMIVAAVAATNDQWHVLPAGVPHLSVYTGSCCRPSAHALQLPSTCFFVLMKSPWSSHGWPAVVIIATCSWLLLSMPVKAILPSICNAVAKV